MLRLTHRQIMLALRRELAMELELDALAGHITLAFASHLVA